MEAPKRREIKEKVIQIICDVWDVNEEDFDMDTDIMEYGDPFDLEIAIEEEFGIEFSTFDSVEMDTIEELIDVTYCRAWNKFHEDNPREDIKFDI